MIDSQKSQGEQDLSTTQQEVTQEENIQVSGLNKIFGGITKFFSDFLHLLSGLLFISDTPIRSIDSLDWDLINQTKDRLVKMRFHQKDEIKAEPSTPSEIALHDTLQATQMIPFGDNNEQPLRQTQKEAIRRWFASGRRANREAIERHMESRLKDPTMPSLKTDEHEILSYQAAPAISVENDANYEPIQLSGLKYEVSPSEPLLIEIADNDEPDHQIDHQKNHQSGPTEMSNEETDVFPITESTSSDNPVQPQ
jgi:hypothetical protein